MNPIDSLANLIVRENKTKAEILSTAQEIQLWVQRVERAKAAKRYDLVKPAEEHVAYLMSTGQRLWCELGQLTKAKQALKAKHGKSNLEDKFTSLELDEALRNLKKGMGL